MRSTFVRFVLVLLLNAATLITVSAGRIDEKKTSVDLITVDELKSKVSANEAVLILDVRSSESYANSRTKIKGALHFNVRKLKFRLGFPPLKDIPKNRAVVTYCACPSEEAAIHAAQILLENGFTNVKALKGGWTEWQKANGPTETRATN